jgi:phospholipid-binding lipoprotein MlaA
MLGTCPRPALLAGCLEARVVMIPVLAAAMLLGGGDLAERQGRAETFFSSADQQATGVQAVPPGPASTPVSSLPAAAPPAATDSRPAPTADQSASSQDDIIVTGRLHGPDDPLRGVNAQTFAATQAIDKAVVGPVAIAYERNVPDPIRSGIRNFFNNLHEPVVFFNYMLQLKPGKAAETAGRFLINSTIGGAGLVDMAKRKPFRLPRRKNSFSDTLGYYGVKAGPFFFLPLIGPTTLRDLIGGTVDRLAVPFYLGSPFNKPAFNVATGTLRLLDRRAEFDEQLGKIRASGDPYAASRDFYLHRRQAEIDNLHGRRKVARPPAGSGGTVAPDPPAAPTGAAPK